MDKIDLIYNSLIICKSNTIMKTNNNFKNIRKRLRNNASVSSLSNNKEHKTKPSNCYDCLDEISSEVNTSNEKCVAKYYGYDRDTVRGNTEENCSENVNFNYLPEDIIYIILQYLSIDTRLKIIKHKYCAKIMRVKLQNISNADINKLFESAKIAQEILNFVFKNETDVIFTKLSTYTIDCYKNKKEKHRNLAYYKENFMEKILSAMKHYSKIYKKIPHSTIPFKPFGNNAYNASRLYERVQYSGNIVEMIFRYNTHVIEEMIFRLYAQIILYY